MSKINNQSNSLDNIEFVRDISPEVTANYSGGAGRLNGAANDPDVILYKDSDLLGDSLNLNAAIGDGFLNIGTNDGNGGGGDNGFNDQTSSIKVLRGTWQFFENINLDSIINSQVTRPLGPGTYNLGANNEKISSARRIG